MNDSTGIVVIGRNEGERLKESLKLVKSLGLPTVYADSASTDDSVATASQFQIPVVRLPAQPLPNAAKGRNAGLKKLLELHPSLAYIHFIDGDTVLDPAWIGKAVQFMEANPDVGIVCGVLEEKEGDSSHFKTLSALEWRAPTGEVKTCGGNLLARRDVLEVTGGWEESLPAGEEIVLCHRVRKAGLKIVRLEAMMGQHESRVQTFREYIRRCIRTGYGYAQVTRLYGNGDEPFYRRELRSALLLGGFLPLMIVLLTIFYGGWPLILLGVYPLLALRIYRNSPEGWSRREAALYAGSCVLAKFPECFGALMFYSKG